MTRVRIFSMVGLAAFAVVFAVLMLVVLPRVRPHAFNAQVMQGIPAPDIELVGPGGEPVALSDFEGQVVAVYFGYTFCPDVCPISLAKLNRARTMLGEDADQVQVVMVTVDPARDTVEVLEEYMSNFDESFIGLTGPEDDIDRIATVYGIYHQAQESTSAAGYLVDHTSTVMVIDKNGELKLLVPYDMTDEEVADDLAYLVG